MAKKGKGKGKNAAKRGVRMSVSYKGLHRQVDLLQKKLGAVRQRLNAAGMPLDSVDDVLDVLKACEDGTRCQKNMLIEFP